MSNETDAALHQLVHRFAPGSRLQRAWPFTGGVSAQVTALELEDADGSQRKVVLRVHGDIDFGNNPNIAADEFHLLGLLQAAGIPAPAPLYLEESGALLGRPGLVTSFIEGTLTIEPSAVGLALRQMADQLAHLHQIAWREDAVTFLPRIDSRIDWLLDGPLAQNDPEAIRIRAALRPRWPALRRNDPTLLHGDYWPGNLLWQDGRLAAVLDWEDAAWGDPLMDLAVARLDLIFAHGPEAMHTFTDHYLSHMPAIDPTALPFWDLCADLRAAFRLDEWFDDPAVVERNRARHRWFMDDALARLAAQS